MSLYKRTDFIVTKDANEYDRSASSVTIFKNNTYLQVSLATCPIFEAAFARFGAESISGLNFTTSITSCLLSPPIPLSTTHWKFPTSALVGSLIRRQLVEFRLSKETWSLLMEQPLRSQRMWSDVRGFPEIGVTLVAYRDYPFLTPFQVFGQVTS